MTGIHNVFMLRPNNFGFNYDTKSTNPFQNNVSFNQKSIAEKAIIEFDEMIEVLVNENINVHVFEDDNKNVNPDAVFLNNWLAVTPEKQLCLFPMFAKSRRKERRGDIIESLKNEILINNTLDLSHYEKSEVFLESTGSIVLDYQNRIAYASISDRTNSKLFEAFCTEIDFEGFSFNASDLNGLPIYHTNVLLSIANQYAIICLDCIESSLERALIVKMLKKSGKVIIEISFTQLMNYSANCLEVFDSSNQSKLVMSKTGYSALNSYQIKSIRSYSPFVIVDIPTIEQVGGGSARCMMMGVPY
ncbi:MAG: citrulline utilization hydrolase CtlX [Crocinitomicaceae bacterium]